MDLIFIQLASIFRKKRVAEIWQKVRKTRIASIMTIRTLIFPLRLTRDTLVEDQLCFAGALAMPSTRHPSSLMMFLKHLISYLRTLKCSTKNKTWDFRLLSGSTWHHTFQCPVLMTLWLASLSPTIMTVNLMWEMTLERQLQFLHKIKLLPKIQLMSVLTRPMLRSLKQLLQEANFSNMPCKR